MRNRAWAARTHRLALAPCASFSSSALQPTATIASTCALGLTQSASRTPRPWLQHQAAQPSRGSLEDPGLVSRRASSSAAGCSAPDPPRTPTLLRHFIHDSLYHPTEGYFTAKGYSVGRLTHPIQFHALLGQSGYRYRLQQLYRQLQVSWLTPVEIFQPYYGQAIAKYLLEAHARRNPRDPLIIYEVGGGTGTLAANILEAVRARHPRVYRSMRYTGVEISAELRAAQHEVVVSQGRHERQYASLAGDATEQRTWEAVGGAPCFVLMTEVLDNLPHDRVWREGADSPWQETLVDGGEDGQGVVESVRPVSDPLVRRCLEAHDWGRSLSDAPTQSLWSRVLDFAAGASRNSAHPLRPGQGGQAVFLPTAALQLMETLHAACPGHQLVAADFDALPDVAIPGKGAPLVAATVGGSTTDFDSYLLPRGSADIFFPTDFDALADLYRYAARSGEGAADVKVKHVSSPDFFNAYADLQKTRTAGVYNPLIQDFANTRLLVGQRSATWPNALL